MAKYLVFSLMICHINVSIKFSMYFQWAKLNNQNKKRLNKIQPFLIMHLKYINYYRRPRFLNACGV